MSSRIVRAVVLAVVAAGWMSCGSTPTAPAPALSGPVTNAPPVIMSVTSTAQPRMEIGQDVNLTAQVQDAEVSVSKLTFIWSANVGVVTGNGPAATWHLTKGTVVTPVDVTITLTVVEKFDNVDAQGHAIVSENRVSQSVPPFHLNDSVAEVTKISLDFLVVYFGNSSISPDACLVDFSNTCQKGKSDERSDIVTNRATKHIFSVDAQVINLAIDPSRTFAAIDVACAFHDQDLGTGATGISAGVCSLTAIYENGRWWLCQSNFGGTCGSCSTVAGSVMQAFIQRQVARGLGPVRPLR